jgi:hypothetical protein
VFEGIAFGLPLVVAKLSGHEIALPLVECGGGVLADGADELTQAVMTAEPAPAHVRELLWKRDPVNNFHTFVDQVIGRGDP